MAPRILVIDNYDSFVYNLVQYVGELGAEPVVHRSDALTINELRAIAPDGVLISPGPGAPAEAGLSNEVIREFTGKVPVLGVCLGHQCIGEVFGATVVRAAQVMHGKTSEVHHDGTGVFAGLPDPLTVTRYHSLVVAPETIADDGELVVTARTADGVVMGIAHREFPVFGVQFHPESILTEAGHDLVGNFVAMASG
jgi:anthranilate synthase/aminodeoxychorismate synthase-like glutamine amidotransferase